MPRSLALLLLLTPVGALEIAGLPAPWRDDQSPHESLVETDELPPSGQIPFWRRVPTDLWGIVSSPVHWDGQDWAIAGTAVAATVATGVFVDQYFQDESQESRSDDKDRWSGTFGQLGTIYSVGVLGAAGAYGWIADDERGVNVLVDGLEASIIASCVIAPTIKFATGRSRPNKTAQDSDVFHPFSGDFSFPSGHTTQAFTVASTLAWSFPDHPVLGGVAFVAAAGVGLSRINDDEHYMSDVVAGAILGSWVGYEVVRFNTDRRGGDLTHPEIHPVLGLEGEGLELSWRW